MSAYEAKLKSGDIFAHNFPEAKIICEEIDTAQYKTANSITDNELIETLLKKYHTCLDDLKVHFKQYEAHVERWFNNLPPAAKK
jgi:ASC-1-like (ASCH) protein